MVSCLSLWYCFVIYNKAHTISLNENLNNVIKLGILLLGTPIQAFVLQYVIKRLLLQLMLLLVNTFKLVYV